MGFCCEDRAFPWKSFLKNYFVQNSRARCPTIVFGSIRKDIEVIGVVLENIVKFLLISAGWVLVLECSFSSRLTLGVLMIQGGVCGKMLSCILFSGIFDSCRVNITRRPKGFIVFSFLSKCWLYFGLKVQSWAGLDGQDFSFVEYWRASFSRLSVRGGSSASVYRLSIGEELYASRASLSPWWCIVFSSFKYVFLAAPYIKQP